MVFRFVMKRLPAKSVYTVMKLADDTQSGRKSRLHWRNKGKTMPAISKNVATAAILTTVIALGGCGDRYNTGARAGSGALIGAGGGAAIGAIAGGGGGAAVGALAGGATGAAVGAATTPQRPSQRHR